MGYCPFSGSGRNTACGVATGMTWCVHQDAQDTTRATRMLALPANRVHDSAARASVT